MSDLRLFARFRDRPDRLCAGCGRPLTEALAVKDIDGHGVLAEYHQRCAPSLGHANPRR